MEAKDYATGDEIPPLPSVLFHWTNSVRFPAYKPQLERGRVPLKLVKRARDGTWDAFIVGQPHFIDTPLFFTWSDIVGGMGSTDVEFYAKQDLDKGVQPRIIGATVNPNARVKKVLTVVEYPTNHLTQHSSEPLDLHDVDLIYHQFHRTQKGQPPSDENQVTREWIIVSQNAVTGVYYHPASFYFPLLDGLERVLAGGPVEAHSYLPFTQGKSQSRAIDVLKYVLSKSGTGCTELIRRKLR